MMMILGAITCIAFGAGLMYWVTWSISTRNERDAYLARLVELEMEPGEDTEDADCVEANTETFERSEHAGKLH